MVATYSVSRKKIILLTTGCGRPTHTILVVTFARPTTAAPFDGAVIHNVIVYAPETGPLVEQLFWASVTLLCETANSKKQLAMTSLNKRLIVINLVNTPKIRLYD